MTYAEAQQHRQQAIQSAMMGLASDQRFGMFMACVKDARELAIDNLTDGNVINSERAMMACTGEIAVYKDLLRMYAEAVANAAQRAEQTSEQP